jgi:hypothetical protein
MSKKQEDESKQVDLLKYCKTPAKYAALPKLTKDHYDAICKLIEESKAAEDEQNKTSTKVGNAFQGIGTMITQLPYLLTGGLITDPSMLTMLLATDPTFGIPRGQREFSAFAKKTLNRAIIDMQKFGFERVQKIKLMKFTPAELGPPGKLTRLGKFLFSLGKITIRAGVAVVQYPLMWAASKSIFLLNSVTLMSCIRNAAFRVMGQMAAKVAGFSGVKGFIIAIRLLTAAGAGAIAGVMKLMVRMNKVFLWLMLVQVIGMIIDAIDPCGFNKQLDAAYLAEMVKNMDAQFRNTMMMQHSYIGTNPITKDMEFLLRWPIDVRVETLFPFYLMNNGMLDDEKQEYRDLIKARNLEFGITPADDELREAKLDMYQALYLGNLKFNSNGQAIYFPTSEVTDLEPNTLLQMQQYVDTYLGMNNPVVVRSIQKYAPVILLAIVGLLFLVFKFIR